MRSTLALNFVLSGASARIFESLWFRLAGQSLGNSVRSASLVPAFGVLNSGLAALAFKLVDALRYVDIQIANAESELMQRNLNRC